MSCHEVRIQPEHVETKLLDLTDEEKRDAVLRDTRFGMCSLTRYILSHSNNKDYSRMLARRFCLPLFVFVAQWLMLVAIVMNDHEVKTCGGGTLDQKLLMISIAMIYFVHSFFVYDNAHSSPEHKVLSSASTIVTLDTFQEHAFTLFVQVTNLYLVYINPNLIDALFNSVALEFLQNLDNEYERMYFEHNIEEAVDVYDNLFVTHAQSRKNLKERAERSCLFRWFQYLMWLPFKCVTLGFILLPIYCFGMIGIGAACK
tara:strand:+ start:1229 stop:2002 length:774 start_codon:yes stop_codon:yes gene_type:complete